MRLEFYDSENMLRRYWRIGGRKFNGPWTTSRTRALLYWIALNVLVLLGFFKNKFKK